MQFRTGFKGAWIVPVAVALDRITKAWAVETLAKPTLMNYVQSVPAIPGVINWHYAENTGAAFSLLNGATWLLSVLTALLIAAICGYLIVLKKGRGPVRPGLWMFVAGGASNLFDRLTYGFVVDFIEFDFVNFAIFNVADVFICVGAGLVLLGLGLEERRKEEQNG